MKRFQVVGVTLFALLAFGVLTVASASAANTVTFLLALWLVNGEEVLTELLTEVTGELLLEDTALKAAVVCSGILDGWVGPESLDYVSEVLSLNGGVVTQSLGATPILCLAEAGCASTGETPNVWPVDLPWETEVELIEETEPVFVGFAVLLLNTPGWEVECTILGVKSSDECKGPEGVAQLILNGTVSEGVFTKEFTELALVELGTCSLGGAKTGLVEGKGAYKLIGELAASSESVVS